jgi:hypothetical protein
MPGEAPAVGVGMGTFNAKITGRALRGNLYFQCRIEGFCTWALSLTDMRVLAKLLLDYVTDYS